MMRVSLFILGAVVAQMALGMVWYLPQTFGTMWMKDTGVDPAKASKKKMLTAMVVNALCAAVTAGVLWGVQYVLGFAALTYFLIGIAFIWLGFVLCVRLMHAMFEGKNIRYVAVTALFDLFSLLIMGAIVYYA